MLEFFESAKWKTPIFSFIDTHCLAFDNEEEHKHEFIILHKV